MYTYISGKKSNKNSMILLGLARFSVTLFPQHARASQTYSRVWKFGVVFFFPLLRVFHELFCIETLTMESVSGPSGGRRFFERKW